MAPRTPFTALCTNSDTYLPLSTHDSSHEFERRPRLRSVARSRRRRRRRPRVFRPHVSATARGRFFFTSHPRVRPHARVASSTASTIRPLDRPRPPPRARIRSVRPTGVRARRSRRRERDRETRAGREKKYTRDRRPSNRRRASASASAGRPSPPRVTSVGRSRRRHPCFYVRRSLGVLFRFETCTLRDIRRPDFRVYAPDRHVATRRGRSVGHGTHNDRS